MLILFLLFKNIASLLSFGSFICSSETEDHDAPPPRYSSKSSIKKPSDSETGSETGTGSDYSDSETESGSETGTGTGSDYSDEDGSYYSDEEKKRSDSEEDDDDVDDTSTFV